MDKKQVSTEIWRDVVGYEGYYQVSNHGNVRALPRTVERRNNTDLSLRGRICSKTLSDKGYYTVGLCKNNKMLHFYVHRLVAFAFLPNPNNLNEVNHIDENPINNFVFVNSDGSVDLQKSNLEWCTHRYNMNHGTVKRRISDKLLNREDHSIPVSQYTSDGDLVAEYLSMTEAARLNDYSESGISAVCCGKRRTYKGFIWKYTYERKSSNIK